MPIECAHDQRSFLINHPEEHNSFVKRRRDCSGGFNFTNSKTQEDEELNKKCCLSAHLPLIQRHYHTRDVCHSCKILRLRIAICFMDRR